MYQRFLNLVFLACIIIHGQISRCDTLFPSGEWLSTAPIKAGDKGTITRSLTLKNGKTKIVFEFFETGSSQALSRLTLEGPSSIKARRESDRLLDVEIKPTSYKLDVLADAKDAKIVERLKCAKKGTVDLQKTACEGFLSKLPAYKVSIVKLDGDMLLMSGLYDAGRKIDESERIQLVTLKKQ